MAVESATYISDLNSANPGATDLKAEGDDHLRLLKTTIKATFPNVTGAVTPTHTVINNVTNGTFATKALTGVTDITTTGNTILGDATTDTLNVGNGGFVKNASGQVLIGTATVGVAADGRTVLSIGNGGVGVFASMKASGGEELIFSTTAGSVAMGAYSATTLSLRTSNSDRVLIDTSGNTYPNVNNAQTLGSAGNRWSTVNGVLGNFSGLVTASAGVSTTGDNDGVGMVRSRSKSATTSRNTTTTLADDPHLVIPLSAGTWAIQLWASFYETTSGTGGIKFGYTFSGTQTSFTQTFTGSVNTALSLIGSSTTIGTGASTGGVGSITTTATTPDYMLLTGQIVVTVAGNFTVQWAQAASTANNTNLLQGSWINCTRVA